jgi:microsomal dipeptidase-like Zn-dependent dipeptidase
VATAAWHRLGHLERQQYATGCYAGAEGFSAQGRSLREFERLGPILDLAGAPQRCVDRRRVPASAAGLLDPPNVRAVADVRRNTDQQIGEPQARGGSSGPTCWRQWQAGWHKYLPLPSVGQAARHPEHIARLGCPEHTGLGSDLDGGLTPENTPAGINTVSDVTLILGQLEQDGWTAEQVAGFAGRNWWRFFAGALPA